MKNEIFDAFANPIRLQLLCCLSEDKKTVSELIANCKLSQSAVSQHLQKLRNAGFVTTKKEGKFIYYSLLYPAAASIAKELKELIEEISKKNG